MQHVIFLQREPMDAFVAGTKRHEFRVATRKQPWMRARSGDRVLLKRVGGDVEFAGTIIMVDLVEGDLGCFIDRWRHATMDGGAYLSRPHARYAGAFEIGDLRPAALPRELTPRNVRSAWVAGFIVRSGC